MEKSKITTAIKTTSALSSLLKDRPVTTLVSLITTVSTIIGAYIAIDSTYAHADTVKAIVENQKEQLTIMRESQSRSNLFYIEYYEGKLSDLERRLVNIRPGTADYLATVREIEYTKQKLDFSRKQLVTPLR